MRWLLVFACACNQVYDLDKTHVRPDDVALDRDGDGASDESDNCIDIANPSQADEDRDTVGNACDNCPLVANADQQDIGDGDGVGDRCDPHPVGVRDCLVVFDSFDDPARFDAHWSRTAPGSAMARADVGQVELSAPLGSQVALHVLDDDGSSLAGDLDLQLAARSTLLVSDTIAILWAAVGVNAGEGGALCGISPGAVVAREFTPAGVSGQARRLSSPPLGEEIFLRMETTSTTNTPILRCLAEYGIVLEGIEPARSLPAMGAPAILLFQGTAIVTGFTAYRNVTTSATCPTPIRR